MLNIYNYFFTVQELTVEELKPKYETTMDGENKYNKEQLFILIKDMINYDIDYKNYIEKGKLNGRINDFQWWLKNQLRDRVIPPLFQQTFQFFYEKQLKEIIYCRLHNENVNLLISLFPEPKEEEDIEDINEED